MTLHFKLVAIVEKTIAIWVCSNQNIINSRKMIFNKYQDTRVHCANIFYIGTGMPRTYSVVSTVYCLRQKSFSNCA